MGFLENLFQIRAGDKTLKNFQECMQVSKVILFTQLLTRRLVNFSGNYNSFILQ
jgi:hypothetical protein